MIKENEVITEVLDNGYSKRHFLFELSVSTSGYTPINKDSVVKLHNCSKLLDSTGAEVPTTPQREGNYSLSIDDFLTRLGVTYEQFALVWADIVFEENKPIVESTDEVSE